MFPQCHCYFRRLCCTCVLDTSISATCELIDTFSGTPPLWNSLTGGLPPMSLLFPVTSDSVNLLSPKLLTLCTALIGALGFWQQIGKQIQLSMPGMCSQNRRRSALIHPPYQPPQTRPTLPFPHIGNIYFYRTQVSLVRSMGLVVSNKKYLLQT